MESHSRAFGLFTPPPRISTSLSVKWSSNVYLRTVVRNWCTVIRKWVLVDQCQYRLRSPSKAFLRVSPLETRGCSTRIPGLYSCYSFLTLSDGWKPVISFWAAAAVDCHTSVPRTCCEQIVMLYCPQSADHFSGGVKNPNRVCEPMQSTYSDLDLDGSKSDHILNYPISSNAACLRSIQKPIRCNCAFKMPQFLCLSLKPIIFLNLFCKFSPRKYPVILQIWAMVWLFISFHHPFLFYWPPRTLLRNSRWILTWIPY